MEHQNIRLIQQFYEVLKQIETKIGGKRTLVNCDGCMPERGVYFFFEPGEARTTTGSGLRVVRVGTHGLRKNGKANLWGRLRQHRGNVGGNNPGGGNHRGSVFRKHLGTALINRDNWSGGIADSWGVGSNASRNVRDIEVPLEREVSKHIGSMPFIWLEIDDAPGPDSLRGYIERNSIALLSNFHRGSYPIDSPSASWLGQWAKSFKVQQSGLWNSNHVDEFIDEKFLDVFKSLLKD